MNTFIVLLANYAVALVGIIKGSKADPTDKLTSKFNMALIALATIIVIAGIFDAKSSQEQMMQIHQNVLKTNQLLEANNLEGAVEVLETLKGQTSSFGGSSSF